MQTCSNHLGGRRAPDAGSPGGGAGPSLPGPGRRPTPISGQVRVKGLPVTSSLVGVSPAGPPLSGGPFFTSTAPPDTFPPCRAPPPSSLESRLLRALRDSSFVYDLISCFFPPYRLTFSVCSVLFLVLKLLTMVFLSPNACVQIFTSTWDFVFCLVCAFWGLVSTGRGGSRSLLCPDGAGQDWGRLGAAPTPGGSCGFQSSVP